MTCRSLTHLATAALVPLSLSLSLYAQAPTPPTGAKPPAPAPSAKALAPYDLTGTWVSVVTEDWRYRMVAPEPETLKTLQLDKAPPDNKPLIGIPLNRAGSEAALRWKPAEAGRCEAFGIGSGMRAPGQVRIAWESDAVLRIEIEAGQQTRRIHFNPSKPAAGPPSWQGTSLGNWDTLPSAIDILRPGGFDTRNANPGAAQSAAVSSLPWTPLKVVTTNFRAGWLRPNGVPYSAQARITEHFMRYSVPGSGEWLTVRTVVDDPTYLEQPFMVSTNFKREADAPRWKPEPCRE